MNAGRRGFAGSSAPVPRRGGNLLHPASVPYSAAAASHSAAAGGEKRSQKGTAEEALLSPQVRALLPDALPRPAALPPQPLPPPALLLLPAAAARCSQGSVAASAGEPPGGLSPPPSHLTSTVPKMRFFAPVRLQQMMRTYDNPTNRCECVLPAPSHAPVYRESSSLSQRPCAAEHRVNG